MRLFHCRAKEGRRVILPGAGGIDQVVPTVGLALFPDSAALARERDLHGDLEVCELIPEIPVAQPELPGLDPDDLHSAPATAKKGK